MSNRKIARLWYCINTHPGVEKRVQDLIRRDLRLITYLPTFIKQGRRKEVELMLFPSYMFVSFNIQIDMWERLYALDGIKRVFSCGPYSPTAIHPSIIARIRLETNALPQPEQDKLYELDQKLKITKGPMKDFVGICTKSTGQRVSILLSLFGREFISEFDIKDITKVA